MNLEVLFLHLPYQIHPHEDYSLMAWSTISASLLSNPPILGLLVNGGWSLIEKNFN